MGVVRLGVGRPRRNPVPPINQVPVAQGPQMQAPPANLVLPNQHQDQAALLQQMQDQLNRQAQVLAQTQAQLQASMAQQAALIAAQAAELKPAPFNRTKTRTIQISHLQ